MFGPVSGMTNVDFFDYFNNTNVGFAIEIVDLQVFGHQLILDSLYKALSHHAHLCILMVNYRV